jgi:hypothetical protein
MDAKFASTNLVDQLFGLICQKLLQIVPKNELLYVQVVYKYFVI